MKIENRANTILFDAAWTAGVQYDENLFDNDEEDPTYDSSDEEKYILEGTSDEE